MEDITSISTSIQAPLRAADHRPNPHKHAPSPQPSPPLLPLSPPPPSQPVDVRPRRAAHAPPEEQRQAVPPAVLRVVGDGVAHVLQVHADLVRAAGEGHGLHHAARGDARQQGLTAGEDAKVRPHG